MEEFKTSILWWDCNSQANLYTLWANYPTWICSPKQRGFVPCLQNLKPAVLAFHGDCVVCIS